jgi:serine/threonine protein phosphatase PrpC
MSQGEADVLWRSSALTIAGTHREANEDAFLDLPQRGAWAVADGLGGHSMGFAASRIVVTALEKALSPGGDAVGDDDLAMRIANATEALHLANADLRALGRNTAPAAIVGATVVVMLAAVDRATVLWVGDARLYVMRGLALHQVTIDHAKDVEWRPAGEADVPSRIRRVLTKAIGSHDALEIETIDIALDAADRFLLCSDGLYKVFRDVDIAEALLSSAPEAVAEVMRETSARQVADDLTMIAIERAPSASPSL